jgi:hypothetical protein
MPIGVSQAPYQPLIEGKRIGGTIVDFKVQQGTDHSTKRPQYLERNGDGSVSRTFNAYNDDGRSNDPICDWVFTVDTGEADENGDTERRVYLDPRKGQKGTDVEGKRGRDAVEAALKRARAHRVGIEIGGKIWITRGPKVAPRRGDAECVTYTAEYEPPPGGPGTGTPVDDQPWLVGGARYTPHTERPVDNPVDQGPPAGEEGSNHAERVREVTDQLARAHASSPVLNRGGQTAASKFDEEPPF